MLPGTIFCLLSLVTQGPDEIRALFFTPVAATGTR